MKIKMGKLRSTRLLTGAGARSAREVEDAFRRSLHALGYKEAIVPALWSQASFERKAATPELAGQMWTFKDKGDRDVCLIPEATDIFQEMAQSKAI